MCMSGTVKFGHITLSWNGNRSGYFNSEVEEYVEIPSDSGITFYAEPKMKAVEIAGEARDAILSHRFQQVRVNLPDGDMVGHTGDIEVTVVAYKAADEAVKDLLPRKKYILRAMGHCWLHLVLRIPFRQSYYRADLGCGCSLRRLHPRQDGNHIRLWRRSHLGAMIARCNKNRGVRALAKMKADPRDWNVGKCICYLEK